MKKKETFSITLATLWLLFSLPVSAEELPEAEPIQSGAGALATENWDSYENNEAVILYQDGTLWVEEYENKTELEEGLTKLSREEDVSLIQPNYTYESTALSADPLSQEQWALSNDGSFAMEEQQNPFPVYEQPFQAPQSPGEWQMFFPFSSRKGAMQINSVHAVADVDINLETAWNLYNGGKREVTVALVDTGIDFSHPELSGRLWENEDEILDNGVDDDQNGYIDDRYGWNFYGNHPQIYQGDEDSHGTHGAGTIVAKGNNGIGISGIVQSNLVKVMPVKALGGQDGAGSTASVIRAIQYAEQNGADICNLSLGTSLDDRALYQTIANSHMLFVVAAGNDGSDIDRAPSYPAAYDLDNIISVANLNMDGSLHSSSNYGIVSVDLAAPGSYILSTTPQEGYSYMTGTSMATPMVSAAAAMVYSQYDDISLADVKEILLSSVKQSPTLQGVTLTGGWLNVGAALAYPISSLSGVQWEEHNGASVQAEYAPEITAYLMNRRGTRYLLVRVTDPDGDLLKTVYAVGIVSAAQFQGGNIGRVFSVNGLGNAIFLADRGTYTFYAADQAGHETVKTITL